MDNFIFLHKFFPLMFGDEDHSTISNYKIEQLLLPENDFRPIFFPQLSFWSAIDYSNEKKGINYTGVLDIPFKNVWFEAYTNDVALFDHVDTDGTKHQEEVHSFIVLEKEPGDYQVIVFSLQRDNGPTISTVILDDQQDWHPFLWMADYFCNEINNQPLIGNQRTKIDIKHRDEQRRFYRKKINDLVYILPKKLAKNEQESLPSEINWTHRWEVRGHWRKIKRMGKNRDGLYVVNGHTWVNPHVKGPDELKLVKKKRILWE